MGVNFEVKEGQTLTVEGPAKVTVTTDVHGSVLIDGEPVGGTPPGGPPPEDPATLSSLSPNTAVAGDAADIEMIVNGSGFTPASVIGFNGLDEPTAFIGDTAVASGGKGGVFVVPADCPVTVRNSGGMSNELTFSFTAAGRSSAARSAGRR